MSESKQPVITEEKSPSGSIAILFSGGLDTTLETVERLKDYEKIYMITFNNGYCINVNGAKRRVKELEKLFDSSRMIHIVVDTSELVKLLLKDHKSLWEKYQSPLLVDLVCKMAAVCHLVYTAKKAGVDEISDGASHEQTEIFLQQPEFSAHIKPGITSYGLKFRPPLTYDLTRDEKMARLKELSLTSGTKALEYIHIGSNLPHQPFCLRGIATFFFTSPFRHTSLVKRYSLPTEKAKEAWTELWPIAKDYLDKKLEMAGVN